MASPADLARMPSEWPRPGPDDAITGAFPEEWRSRYSWVRANLWRSPGVVALETCFDPRRPPGSPPTNYNGIDRLGYRVECVAAGWPWAMVERRWCDCGVWSSGQEDQYLATIPAWRRGIRLPMWLERFTDPTTLPTSPIWSGLVMDTLAYAAILWTLIAGPELARGYLRRRRGLCPSCAYEVRELPVCPECGRPAHSARAN